MRPTIIALVLLISAVPLSDGEPTDALPDWFAVLSVWPPTPDVPAAIKLTVVNDDDDCNEPSVPVEIDILVDGVLFERATIGPIDPCTDTSYTAGPSYVGPPGMHTFTTVIDPRDLIAEANESNNVRHLQRLFAHERPDLAVRVTDISSNSWPLTRVQFQWEVCNIGTAPTNVAHQITIWMGAPDDGLEHVGTVSRGPLAIQACSTGSMNGNAGIEFAPLFPESIIYEPVPIGMYRYKADVYQEYAGPLRELDYSNNVERGEFYVGPPGTCEFPPTEPCL